MAFAGAQMPARFGVVVCEEGRPMLMAAMSDRLPAAGRAATRAEAVEAIDEILDRLDELFRDPDSRPVQMRMNRAAVKAAAMAMLKQRLDTQLHKLLQQTAYEAFADLRRSKRRFYANELGRLIHRRMAARTTAEIAQVAPEAWVRTEKTLKSICRELLAGDKTALEKANTLLEEPITALLTRRPEVLDILGVEKTATARSKESIAKLLRERFGWKSQTTIGDLQSDLTIADIEMKRVINVDWTASTNSDRFERVWGKVVDDLGGKFDGDWDAVAEAYRRAGKGDVPAEVKSGLEELTRHAVRETIIRKVALEEVLGLPWNISSHEMTYDGLRKLYAME
jgi:hypothetical protein